MHVELSPSPSNVKHVPFIVLPAITHLSSVFVPPLQRVLIKELNVADVCMKQHIADEYIAIHQL